MHKKDFIQQYIIRMAPVDEQATCQAIDRAEASWEALTGRGYGSPQKTAQSGLKIPVQQVINAYHQSCPTLPRVVSITDSRRRGIETRWRKGMNTVEMWRQYFSYCNESDFLLGNTGDRKWKANIDFLLREDTIVNVQEGKYHG